MEAPEPAPWLVADLISRARTYDAWSEQVRRAGYCERPVRLAGVVERADTATGELHPVFASDAAPDGVVLKACGTRRAACCRPCSEVYRRDAWQLVAAGLRGGKGIPETVLGHPMVFATFTAPSFGVVHAHREDGGTVHPCHPARRGDRCAHGRRMGCWHRHGPDDPALGAPLCLDCYDTSGQVVWNALAGTLWRRTTISLRRALARQAGLPPAALNRQVRVSYAKVAEYQARGAIHYHAIIRLDGRHPDPEGVVPPPAGFTTNLLVATIRRAAGQVCLPWPAQVNRPPALRGWGVQLDLREITTGGPAALSAEAVAGYLAKYATKATEGYGPGLAHPITTDTDLAHLATSAHVAALVQACWQLGGRAELAGLRLRRWAHQLGYGGHFLTKSRRYATTFRALRAARRAWAAIRHHGPDVTLDRDGRPLPPDGTVQLAAWVYTGRGYTTAADAWLAASARAQQQQMRVAREELTAVA